MNKEKLQEYNSILGTNNVSLEAINNAINELPTIDEILQKYKITNCERLFWNGARTDYINEISSLIDESCTNFEYAYYKCLNTEFPMINTSNGITFDNMYYDCNKATILPSIDTSKAETMGSMYRGCTLLQVCPLTKTSNCSDFNNALRDCTYLTTIYELDFGKVNKIQYMVYNCNSLENVGGFKDLGKGFTQQSASYTNYKLDLSKSPSLTYESLMNIINGLYDLNLTYDVANGGTLYTQQLVLGTTNKNKLSSEEIAIATDKGWVVS